MGTSFKVDVPLPEIIIDAELDTFCVSRTRNVVIIEGAFDVEEARALRDYLTAILPDEPKSESAV